MTESDSSPIISVPLSTDDNESFGEGPTRSSNIDIEEVFENDHSPIDVPEPVITEQDEVPEASNEKQSDMVTEIPIVRALTNNVRIVYCTLPIYNLILLSRSGRIKCNCRI